MNHICRAKRSTSVFNSYFPNRDIKSVHSLGIFRRLADLSIVQFESDLILHGSREAFQDFERVNEKQQWPGLSSR